MSVLVLCVFCDSFLCSISFLLLSDFLSCIFNSVLYMHVLFRFQFCAWWFITPAGCTKLLLEFSILLCCSHYYFLFLSVLLPMASFSRGQLPAQQTKVVDDSQRLLKTGSPGCGNLRNDGTSSKPYCTGRDVAEDSQGGACVECCGSKRWTIFCR